MPTNSDYIINKRFDELVVRFRPEFGNVRHIEIVNDLGKLKKCEDLPSEKQKVAAGIPELPAPSGNLWVNPHQRRC